MDERLTEAEVTFGVHSGHASACAGSAGRPVERAGPGGRIIPIERARRDHDRILAIRPGRNRRGREFQNADSSDLRVLGVDDRKLLACRSFDHLASANDLRTLTRNDFQTGLRGIDDRVPHAAIRNIESHRADMGNFDHPIEMHRECRAISEGHPGDLAMGAGGSHIDQTGRRFQHQPRFRLMHRQHAGFEQHRDDADRVRSGHRRIFDLLHDDESGICRGIGGWQQDIAAESGIAARLPQHEPADVVPMALEMPHLIEHRCAGNVDDTAGDDSAGFTARMSLHGSDHAVEPHQTRSRWIASAIFSPIIMTGKLVLARGIDGISDASATRSPATP